MEEVHKLSGTRPFHLVIGSIILTFKCFEGTALLGLQYISFLFPSGNSLTLQRASLLSICKAIAERVFFFSSLKIHSLETEGPDEDARQDTKKMYYANFFSQLCRQFNKGIDFSYESHDSMLLFLLRSCCKLSAITLKITNHEEIWQVKLYFQ